MGRTQENKTTTRKSRKAKAADRFELIRLAPRKKGGLPAFCLRTFAQVSAALIVLFHAAILTLAFSASLVFTFINPPITSISLYRTANDLYLPQKAEFIPLSKIPDYVQNMFIKLEDANFYKHHGIDLGAMKHAYEVNKKYGQIILGGSTITQQLARTLFLVPDRTYVRKYAEIIMALSMELVLSKKRILELYLNNIEWGKGVYGLGAAAYYHFNKPYYKLDYDHICRLAAIIVNPLLYNVKNLWGNPVIRFRYAIIYNRFLP
jgi:monofunctional biosynthetic peptidoglycan transglycosylase